MAPKISYLFQSKTGFFEYHTPIHIGPTGQYLDRKAKFTKWLELSEYKQGE